MFSHYKYQKKKHLGLIVFYQHLIVTIVFILICQNKLSAQQNKPSVANKPEVVVSQNGKYTICVDGSVNESSATNKKGTLTKSGNRITKKSNASDVGEKTAVRSLKFGGTENLGKEIKYGPWKMLNNFKLPAYNFDEFYSYNTSENKKSGGGAGNVKQLSRVNPDQVSILELSQNSQVRVLIGQKYSVQVGYFEFDKNAYAAVQKVTAITSLPVIVIIKNGIYHILVEGFPDLKDANQFVIQLAKIGYRGGIVKINTPQKTIH